MSRLRDAPRQASVGRFAVAAVGGATLLAALLLAWPRDADPPSARARLALGQAVYAQHCASCHGAQLEGQPDWRSRRPDGRMPAPPHDASGHTWHHTEEQLFRITKHGIEALAPPGFRSDMPAYGDVLSDDEIRAVLAYIESTWPDDIRRRRAQMNARTR